MELKEIKVDQILANFYQPRTKFDREKIKELAESILSNGLINPITIFLDKKRKGKYMIVSGERRWQAHKVAKIKTIPCIVKEYKNDGQFMVESLIENIHREDLTPIEKGKFCLSIMKEERIKNYQQLSNRIKSDPGQISRWIDEYDFKKRKPKFKDVETKIIRSTKALPEKERESVIDFAKKEGKSGSFIEEDFMPEYRKSDEPTRKALLSGKVSVEEAKRESIPEPIQYEETANDVGNDILSNLHDFNNNVDRLFKEMNVEDLSKTNANQLMTTAGLHMKHFMKLVHALRQRGAKPNPLILALIRAKNGKI